MLAVQGSQVVLDLIVAFKREYVDVRISQHPCRLLLPAAKMRGFYLSKRIIDLLQQ